MAGNDAWADFRELLLLQRAPAGALTTAGALGLLPLAAVAAAIAALAVPSGRWISLSVFGYGLAIGAVAAWAYRRGHIPYRRGDLAAAFVFALGLMPGVLAAARDVPVIPALLVTLMPALALEIGWRAVFAAVLPRLAGLNLDLLVHEALREQYGDDWQAFAAHITADLREARRLRELADRGADPEGKS